MTTVWLLSFLLVIIILINSKLWKHSKLNVWMKVKQIWNFWCTKKEAHEGPNILWERATKKVTSRDQTTCKLCSVLNWRIREIFIWEDVYKMFVRHGNLVNKDRIWTSVAKLKTPRDKKCDQMFALQQTQYLLKIGKQ